MNEKVNKKQYMPLVVAAGIGSMLGSGTLSVYRQQLRYGRVALD